MRADAASISLLARRAQPGIAGAHDLKFFCGFTLAEIAAMKNVSERTVQRHWEKARLMLYRALSQD